MPRIPSDAGLPLPFSGSVSLTRHCSHEGAKQALPRAGSQAMRVLLAIKEHGPVTDQQLVALTGLPLNVVNARRHALAEKALIYASGTVMGPRGVRNTTWTFGSRLT